MIEIHKDDETRNCHDFELKRMERLGWSAEAQPETKPDPDDEEYDEAMVLYKRPKGEWVEGQEPPDQVIIDSDSFPAELVNDALREGWFKTREEAVDAPPDKPESKE